MLKVEYCKLKREIGFYISKDPKCSSGKFFEYIYNIVNHKFELLCKTENKIIKQNLKSDI